MAIAAVAAATAMVGAVTVAVGWAVTASITGRPNIEIAMPMAPTLPAAVAEADDDDAPIYTGSLQVSDHRINVPHLKIALGFSIVAKNPMTPDLVVAKDPMPARFVLASVETPSRSVAARSPIAPPIEPPLPREASLGRADGPETPAQRARPVAVASLAPVNIPPALPERPDPVPLPRTRPDIVGIKPALDEARIAPDPVQAAADARTAVYDIEARTVYLPGGRRLEAHSGLGSLMDDPRHVRRRMRGATPPNTYELKLREATFHGVRAIRLNPVNEDKMYGRDGILAHSYMLGPNGQSNGCVSFKNYPQFLQAFLKGEINRMVVVPRLETAMAARFRIRPAGRYAFDSR